MYRLFSGQSIALILAVCGLLLACSQPSPQSLGKAPEGIVATRVEWRIPLGDGHAIKLAAAKATGDETGRMWRFESVHVWVLQRAEMLSAERLVWDADAKTLLLAGNIGGTVNGLKLSAEAMQVNLDDASWVSDGPFAVARDGMLAEALKAGGRFGRDADIWMERPRVRLAAPADGDEDE